MIFDLLVVLPLVWSDPPLAKESPAPPPALIANPPINLVQKSENGRLLRWPEPSHVAVQKLNLSHSDVGDAGAAALAAALKTNTTLQVLALECNSLSAVGAASLVGRDEKVALPPSVGARAEGS